MKTTICCLLFISIAMVNVVCGEGFVDPGFETYSVASGGFVKPTSGPWMFTNDAGVVAPYAANSSTGALNTWSATLSAKEGKQYASTYAGIDRIYQTISFNAAGDYSISVFAAAASGTVFIPSVGTLTCGDGQFAFTLGTSNIGSPFTVSQGSSWTLYDVTFTIDQPGNYNLGVRNADAATYFINYDSFSIQPVPEPSSIVLLGLVAMTSLAAIGKIGTRKDSNDK